MAKGFNNTRVFFIVVCSFCILFPALGQNATITGDNTICQGTSTNLTFSLTGAQPWKLTYTDGTNLMTVTGISSSPYTISVSPTSTTTYSLTDFSDANGTGTFSGVVVITVNPTPQVVPNLLSQTICNDVKTNITLSSPSIFTSGVITFNYTVVSTGGVTGFTTPMTELPKDYVIADVLHNPTDSPQTVTYTIVPISPLGCPAGPSKIVIVTVNPTPQIVPSTLNKTICNYSATNVTLSSPSAFSNGLITFNYTVVATGGVTGFTTPMTELPKDYVIADVLHNPTDSPQTVTYTIVPISPSGCPAGPSKIVIVTVNPTPQIVPSTLNKTICNYSATNVTLSSPSAFSNGLITFNYTVVATGGVTGFTTPMTELPKDYVIADVLHNPTDSPQTVTYTIVPISPSGCPAGPSKIVIVTVNPTPQIVPSTLNKTICNYSATNVTLSSPSAFSNGLITFNYTVAATGGVTGFTTPMTELPKDYVIADVLHNPTDSPQTVTYTIVPISPSGCPAGPSKIVVITIKPLEPIISGSSNVKEDETGSVYSVTEVEGNTYSWTVLGGNITSGASTNSITVTWGTVGIGEVDITETTTLSGCTGIATKSVTISQLTSVREVQNDNGLSLSNYPNPFVGFTTIAYSLSSEGFITLTIRNLSGQVVKSFLNEKEPKGDYTLNIETSDLQSGVYIVTLSLKNNTKETSETIKILKQ